LAFGILVGAKFTQVYANLYGTPVDLEVSI
jgi:hypothetical protein